MERDTVRKFPIQIPTTDDADGLIAMHAQSWIDAYPSEVDGISEEVIGHYVARFSSPEGRLRRKQYIEEAHSNPNYFLRIAKNSSGKIVGFIDTKREEKNEINGLYIAKDMYGSGLGLELGNHALDWLDRSNDIVLNVAAHNGRAQAFYKKLGFEIKNCSETVHQKSGMKLIDMVRKGDRK